MSKSTEIVSLYYNPNIHPKSEYMERLRALKNTISEIQEKNIKLVVPDYKPKEYIQNIAKEGERCPKCWELRLRFLFDYAKLKGFNLVTSTLLIILSFKSGYHYPLEPRYHKGCARTYRKRGLGEESSAKTFAARPMFYVRGMGR